MKKTAKKYFILDESKKIKEVFQEEHAEWARINAKRYNREFIRHDGSKHVTLIFQGFKEVGKDLVMFSVRSIFKPYDGYIVTDFIHDFDTLEDATEQYEMELLINGDKE